MMENEIVEFVGTDLSADLLEVVRTLSTRVDTLVELQTIALAVLIAGIAVYFMIGWLYGR